MSEILTKPYEISVWEDKLITDGNEYKFEEVKIAVIGSNTMTGLNKVYDPVFNKKSNGERTLSFSLKYKYFNSYEEKEVINPIVNLLVNERKIKLKYDTDDNGNPQWYEFIIKEHSESSDGMVWTYTCNDAFVLELSKQGYNITFDTELNNNQGTAYDLARATLVDTDWRLGPSEVGRQLVAEPIYKAVLYNADLVTIKDTDHPDVPPHFEPQGLNIYLFYSYVANKDGKFVQFIIRNEDVKQYVIDSKNIITATNFRILQELTYKESDGNNSAGFYLDDTQIIEINDIEQMYQANRLAYAQLNTYDPVMGRTVDRFSVDDGDLEVYKYIDYTYTTSNVVVNYITNGDNFNALDDGTLQGWNAYTDQYHSQPVNKIELTTKPKLATGQKLVDLSLLSQIEGFLQARFNGPRTDENNKIYNTIFNSGIENHLSLINSIAKGDKFVFRWRAGVRDSEPWYILTEDEKLKNDKIYYELINDSYEVVSNPPSGSNPKLNGWYEQAEDDLDCLVPFQNLGLILAKYTQDSPTRFGYYYKHINPADIIATFELSAGETPQILNNYIRGGTLQVNLEGKYEYVINGVVQKEPSLKYIYETVVNDETKEYIWDGINGTYVEKNDKNYLPYYYLVAEATEAINSTKLKSADNRYGLFFYIKDNNSVPTKEVIIDKQFVEGGAEPTLETATEEIFPQLGTNITACLNNDPEYTFNFIAGTSDNAHDECVYNASKNTITFADSTNKISSYTITYTKILPIYIQDIEFTRFIPDEDGITPIIIGNVPTAVSTSNDYYYVQPDEDDEADDITLYTNLSELIQDRQFQSVEPLYNENSEKYLTITASQSNCFNILQSIAETFECWIDLKVEHDSNGAIIVDEDGRPRKYVCLKEYVGKDNYAGFKYGINLDTIERTVNSEEFVTKLIVDQSQCEYVDEGFVSIASASSNTSKESYILNFDYYYSQGLLDRDKAELDRLDFISDLSRINIELNEKEQIRRDLEASLTSLGSNRNVYTELIENARELKNDALVDFEKLTNQTYEEYRQQHGELIDEQDITDEPHSVEPIQGESLDVLTNIYPVNDKKITVKINFWQAEEQIATFEGGIAKTFSDTQNTVTYDGEQTFTFDNVYVKTGVIPAVTFTYTGTSTKQLTDEQTIYDILGAIYVNSATINNYTGLLTNVNQEYDKIHEELYGYLNYNVKVWVDWDRDGERHVYVELNDYLQDFKFSLENDPEEYVVSLSKKYFDIRTDATSIIFTPPTGYTIEPASSGSYPINDYQINFYKVISNETKTGVIDEIAEIRNRKNNITKVFNNKYSRYIQEGTWNSTDYIDAEKYYLDALQVSNTSAEPTVTYTINVVEISQLEEYEWYQFDAGDKSYVEDTEFFGWEEKDGVLTPVQEEVIVSEVEWHLDEPDKNTITVQNYKTRFDDLFQRISATVQTVQYNEATYAKISTLLDADGTLNPETLLDSLNSISGQRYTLTSDGSVTIDGENILIQNLTNPINRVIINNRGIQVSEDGGVNWTSVIDGRGVNAGAVYTGSLNTDNIIIGNRDYPSFRWDKSGISAYKQQEDETEPYDLQTFVRFDQYGLYGIKDNGSFIAQNLDDILDKAHFAVTWDGFFIKNSYEGGGRVEITSNNDFRVLNSVDGEENEKIKIGALEWMVITEDTSVQDKTYYQLSGGQYIRVEEPTGNPHQLGYYEKKLEPQDGVAPSLYGIRMLNNAGEEVMKTGDDGNLTIVGTIEALGANFSQEVTVGKNDPTETSYILIDGVNSAIQSVGGASDWKIDRNGDAIFNNITARGAIRTAVFEYSEVQAVGGIFIFRPSSTIKTAVLSENEEDIIITVDRGKEFLFSTDDWCKVSNYTEDVEIEQQLVNSGLANIYKIERDDTEITLIGAAEMLSGDTQVIDSVSDLVGGALIDMGNEEDNTANYGIGINSSDNAVNLPPRSLSLFETTIHSEDSIKASYDYKGVLGTLPELDYQSQTPKVNQLYHDYLENTQGIYTDNMYIGDANQYIAFYTDGNDKKLKIQANELFYSSGNRVGQYIWYNNGGAYIAAGDAEKTFNVADEQTYGYNTAITGTELALRYNDIPLSVLTTDGLQIKRVKEVSGGEPQVITVASYGETTIIGDPAADVHMEIDSTSLGFYGPYDTPEKRDSARISYLDSNKLYIPYSVVLNEMIVGTRETTQEDLWAWKVTDSEHLRLVWKG